MDFLSKNLEIFSNLVEPSAGFGRTDLSARWTFLQDSRRFSIFLKEPQITLGLSKYRLLSILRIFFFETDLRIFLLFCGSTAVKINLRIKIMCKFASFYNFDLKTFSLRHPPKPI